MFFSLNWAEHPNAMLGLYNGTMKLNPYLSTLLCKAITFGGTKKNFVNGTVQSIGHCKTDIPS